MTWTIYRDNKKIATVETENAALAFIHKAQGQSWAHAFRYEGWAIKQDKQKKGGA